MHTKQSLALAAAGLSALTSAQAAFDWKSIEPSEDIVYHDCFGKFKCARLLVPLNWKDESDTRKAAIAIQKLPAKVDSTDPSFGGSVLTNPGGPGDATNTFVQVYGDQLQCEIDTPGERHHEIIGFDTRGIGQSTPAADCFTQNPLARPGSGYNYKGTFRMDDGRDFLSYDLAQMEALSMACKKEDAKHTIMPYMDTRSVVNDMVRIIDKLEEERDAAAAKRGLRNIRRDVEDVPRLQYIGFSYGTTLANYFVSLFPGRTARVVFDGVQDAEDYSNGPGWLTNTEDMDEVIEQFLENCYKAGQAVCPVTRDTDSSAQDTKDRYYNGLKALDDKPLPYLDQFGNIGALTADDLKLAVGTMTYSPIDFYKPFSVIINATISGDPLPLIGVLESTGTITVPQLYNTDATNKLSTPGFEALAGVLCLDGDDVTGKDIDYWSDYIQQQVDQSLNYGEPWATLRFYCSYWPWKPVWNFKGPFTTPEADPSGVEGKPLAPLLFISNRYDSVTPLSSARRMHDNHPGSGLVIQESTGHCALVSAPSDCTRKVVQKYFATGEVPSDDKICQAKCGPWDAGCINTCLPISNGTVAASKRSTNTPTRDIYNEDYDWAKLKLRKFPLGVELGPRGNNIH